MAKRLDEESRELLAYRPDIQFVEPEVEPGEIEPVEAPVQLEDIEAERQKVKQLAKAVNALATAVQARVDGRAKGMVIKLDPSVDAHAIAAMRRLYPDDDPTKITFEQYRSCKEDMREQGEAIGKQASITPKQVEKAIQDQAARAAVGAGGTFTQFGGFNTPEAINGGLRPELDKNSHIIPPLDIPKFQDIMIKILVNFLWTMFILPAVAGIPGAKSVLPKELVEVPEGMVDMMKGVGIAVLGE